MSVTTRKSVGSKPNPDDCLYHSDPALFRESMAELRKALDIPTILNKRAAMAVCSCRRGKTCNGRSNTSDLHAYINESGALECLLKSIDTIACLPLSPKTTDFVDHAVRDVMSRQSESAIRMVALLTMAFGRSFRLLEEECRSVKRRKLEASHRVKSSASSPEDLMRHEQKLKKRSDKFSQKSFSALLQKRKRQAGGIARIMNLQMFGGNSNLLQERADIGKNFQKISSKFKPCVIQVDYTKTGKAMAENKLNTVLKVWCVEADFFKIRAQLAGASGLVQEKETQKHRQMLQIAKQRRIMAQNSRFHNKASGYKKSPAYVNVVADPESVREERWDSFSAKMKADSKQKNRSNDYWYGKVFAQRCVNCMTIRAFTTPSQDLLSKRSCSDATSITKSISDGEEELSENCKISTCNEDADNIGTCNGHNVSTKQKTGPVPSGDHCKYHPGFLIRHLGKWSCCLQNIDPKSIDTGSNLTEAHRNTGCQTSPTHAWRPYWSSSTNEGNRILKNVTKHQNKKKDINKKSVSLALREMKGGKRDVLRALQYTFF